ncbi:hypothetical protein SLEP1_g14609 [Rubroshorea leprosula]|uniref:Uncharacterized protein n=1 Tax=Rubroshorea leprosula TaxID=152421 RepID=A0AAV5IV76_9ROSI|nr:hypothetical protein SLEP1_g14609 [Rubroshorea leprosula]
MKMKGALHELSNKVSTLQGNLQGSLANTVSCLLRESLFGFCDCNVNCICNEGLGI